MRLIIVVMALFLTGCATIEKIAELQNPPPEKGYQRYQPAHEQQSLHGHVEKLARQLLDTTNLFDVDRAIAVGTFLPAESLQVSASNPHHKFGIQIQESFVTFLTQAGLQVVEFKIQNKATVKSNADVFVSRTGMQNEQNAARLKAEYLLIGNYTQQQNDLMVNVRLVSAHDKTVIAAATDYIPINTMWSHDKVKLKNDQLYRGEY